ncbi:MAG TPA: hypothetical protein VLT16_08025 [Candidatus Limnocylindrales bacterium]|nr:hypothetical protein [Candidatus Limnocylindrales bacterium]
MKTTLVAVFAIALSLNVAAKSSEPAPPATASARTDLTAMLSDAETVASSTSTDLSGLNIEKWPAGWKTGWIKKGANKQEVGQTADSAKQAAGSLPGIIAAARTAHGNISSTFKLYNGLTQACENLNPLVAATKKYGEKDDYTRLAADYANLVRVRNSVFAYVVQRAELVDLRSSAASATASSRPAGKPAREVHAKARKTVARKKAVVHYSN